MADVDVYQTHCLEHLGSPWSVVSHYGSDESEESYIYIYISNLNS